MGVGHGVSVGLDCWSSVFLFPAIGKSCLLSIMRVLGCMECGMVWLLVCVCGHCVCSFSCACQVFGLPALVITLHELHRILDDKDGRINSKQSKSN
jgi:hypothetical protein